MKMKFIIDQLFGVFAIGICLLGCSGSSGTSRQADKEQNPKRTDQFVTKRDTVEVNIVASSKVDTQATAVRDSLSMLVKSDSSSTRSHIFTIQVGAFESEANARRWEEQAKDILKMPTYIEFDKRNKQFRVTIGTFSTRESAFEVLKDLKVKYAAFYRDAWVSESLRVQQ